MTDVTIPTLNANDDTYILLEWLIGEGQPVTAGDPIATIETSKATTDLEAERTGYLHPTVTAGDTCRPGDIIGHITHDNVPPRTPATPITRSPTADDVTVSRAAQELINQHRIPDSAIRALDLAFVRSSDILTLIERPDTSPLDANESTTDLNAIPLDSHQRAVARTVTLSHHTIPTAFAVIKIAAGQLLQRCDREAQQARTFVGIAEIVISVVARLRETYPYFFAKITDDLTVLPAQQSDIGITIDVGTGLYVPVVRKAEQLTPAEIAAALMRLRARAVRRGIRDQDLATGSLTLTLQTEPDLILAQPIIFPGQTCALTLCAIQQEIRLGPDNSPHISKYFYLGLAYDHRAINGRDAGSFLSAIKKELERP